MSTNEFMTFDFQAAAHAYKSPRVGVGDIVLIYPNADTTKQPIYGHVFEVWPDVIGVQDFTGRRHNSVHHIGNPGLQVNQDWRLTGGWDHTDQTKRYRQIEEALVLLCQGKSDEAGAVLGGVTAEVVAKTEEKQEAKKKSRPGKKKLRLVNMTVAKALYQDVSDEDLRAFCSEQLKEAGHDSRGIHTAGRDTLLRKLSTLGNPAPPADMAEVPADNGSDGGDGDPVPVSTFSHV